MHGDAANSLDLFTTLAGLLGGLALFLYGMERLTTSLEAAAGEGLRGIIRKLTGNRFSAALAGASVTAVVQSSSVTTVLVVGFVSAGLMTMQQSVGVILGANVGTTLTAQVIAFKVTEYSMVMIALGFGLTLVRRPRTLRPYGTMLLALGLLFLGMQQMTDATGPLREYPPFVDAMRGLTNPVYGLAVGAVLTALVQSSSATTGIVIVLASQGFLTLDAGIALVLGANVGTCVTAWLAALRSPVEARRAALVHVLFNVVGVALWIGLIGVLADLVRSMSPGHPELSEMARRAAEVPRQLANAHTVFNVANTFIFIWFTGVLARLSIRLIPDEEREPDGVPHFDASVRRSPALGLERARLEIVALGRVVEGAYGESLGRVLGGTNEELDELAALDARIDRRHAAIVEFLLELAALPFTERESARQRGYLSIVNYLENAVDTIEKGLVQDGRQRASTALAIPAALKTQLNGLHERIAFALGRSIDALETEDAAAARECIEMREEIRAIVSELRGSVGARDAERPEHRSTLVRFESDVIENVYRVYYFARHVAQSVVALPSAQESDTETTEGEGGDEDG